jgi:putative salt-induced outer membrane protein YdiY
VVEAIYRSATKDISHNQDQQYGWNYGQYDQWGQYGQSVQYDHNDPQSHQVLLHAAQPTSTPSTAYSDNPLTIKNDSQDKKKPSRTSYKLGYTQKSGRPKDQKSHRSDRGDQLQEGEVYLTNLESSHEMDLFALNHQIQDSGSL